MRYKVENILSTDPDDPDKIRILSVVYETFEEVIRKVNRDLQSIWKDVVPLPLNFIIMEAEETDKTGVTLYDNNRVEIAHNEKDVSEALEVVAHVAENIKDDKSYSKTDEVVERLLRGVKNS